MAEASTDDLTAPTETITSTPGSLAWIVRRALTNPGHLLMIARGLLRGYWCRAYHRARGVRFSTGRHFRVYARLKIQGPGEVRFGDHVRVIDAARFWTHGPDAQVIVGDHVVIGAVDLGCAQKITVGRDSILARCTIMDTDFHSTRADRWDPRAPVRVAPVEIGDNVWVAGSVGILPGTKIGTNSVVSFGAVCMREYPENVIIMGNPAKVAAPIPPTPPTRASAPPL